MRARVCLPHVFHAFPFPSPLALLDPALLMLWPWLADGRARATSRARPAAAGRERKLTSPSLKQVIYYQMKNWHDGSGGGESGPWLLESPVGKRRRKGKESKGKTRDTGGVLRVLNRKTAFKH